MKGADYSAAIMTWLNQEFVANGYELTAPVALDPVPESAKYHAVNFALNHQRISYRRGKVTKDRPGAFLAIWQRPSLPSLETKPIPLGQSELDFLFVEVQSNVSLSPQSDIEPTQGLFVFPVDVLVAKGIISSSKRKGKTGFRVFPPWSADRGIDGTKVFSESGKRTQRWQLPYFVARDKAGKLDQSKLRQLLS